jgi:hypothetical protein
MGCPMPETCRQVMRVAQRWFLLAVCLFGFVWAGIIVPVLEPKGSGGFGLSLLSFWITSALVPLVTIDVVVMSVFPNARPFRLAMLNVEIVAAVCVALAVAVCLLP